MFKKKYLIFLLLFSHLKKIHLFKNLFLVLEMNLKKLNRSMLYYLMKS